ncbi:MAG: hypothetical protein J3K34DRAFT_469505 [Monoraphidium minutum]|nr:MAG: hypothetical protein J3K34DRAFT_469505 [Monoraphidium minutum]
MSVLVCSATASAISSGWTSDAPARPPGPTAYVNDPAWPLLPADLRAFIAAAGLNPDPEVRPTLAQLMDTEWGRRCLELVQPPSEGECEGESAPCAGDDAAASEAAEAFTAPEELTLYNAPSTAASPCPDIAGDEQPSSSLPAAAAAAAAAALELKCIIAESLELCGASSSADKGGDGDDDGSTWWDEATGCAAPRLASILSSPEAPAAASKAATLRDALGALAGGAAPRACGDDAAPETAKSIPTPEVKAVILSRAPSAAASPCLSLPAAAAAAPALALIITGSPEPCGAPSSDDSAAGKNSSSWEERAAESAASPLAPTTPSGFSHLSPKPSADCSSSGGGSSSAAYGAGAPRGVARGRRSLFTSCFGGSGVDAASLACSESGASLGGGEPSGSGPAPKPNLLRRGVHKVAKRLDKAAAALQQGLGRAASALKGDDAPPPGPSSAAGLLPACEQGPIISPPAAPAVAAAAAAGGRKKGSLKGLWARLF